MQDFLAENFFGKKNRATWATEWGKIGNRPSLSKNRYFDDILASLFMDSKKIKNMVKKIKISGKINTSNYPIKKHIIQHSKIVQSRHDWRRKAVQRAEKMRDYRKSQKRHQEKIAELQEQITEMEQSLEKKLTNNYS
jgi:hypothetical protein